MNALAGSFVALIAVFALPQAVVADETADALRKWGLLGTWALDCGSSASLQHVHLTYAIKQGQAVYEREYGSGQDVNQILNAAIAADGSLELRMRLPKQAQTRDMAFTKSPDGGKYRTLFSRQRDGEYTVKDGIIIATKAPTKWLTRCR